MKKVVLILFISSFGSKVLSQTTTFDQLNANYGFSKKIEWFTSGSGDGFGHKIYNHDPGGKTLLNFAGRHNSSSWADILTITSDGYIGIGTTSPAYKLDVNGNVGISTHTVYGPNPNGEYLQVGGGSITSSASVATTDGNLHLESKDGHAIYLNYSSKGDILWGNSGAALTMNQGAAIELRGTGLPFIDFSNDASTDYDMRMILVNDDLLEISGGKVGIGTSEIGSHRLAVEGSIGARQVKIEASGWSDFVFEKDYELPTLEEVEKHIADKGHLPEIPSEAEVIENGINLGEMDAKLLQKIEELTLYMIDLNKQNQTQQAEIKELREEIKLLKNE